MDLKVIIGSYLIGMLIFGTKLCCSCDEHAGRNLINLLFWFIMYPYEILKALREDYIENYSKKGREDVYL